MQGRRDGVGAPRRLGTVAGRGSARLPVVAARPLAAWLAVGSVGTSLRVGGCGDDGPSDEQRAEVVLALGFLTEDFGYTEAQVDCVQQDLEEHVGDDLPDWGRTLRRLDRGEVAVTDLDAEDEEVLVGAISRCAVEVP